MAPELAEEAPTAVALIGSPLALALTSSTGGARVEILGEEGFRFGGPPATRPPPVAPSRLEWSFDLDCLHCMRPASSSSREPHPTSGRQRPDALGSGFSLNVLSNSANLKSLSTKSPFAHDRAASKFHELHRISRMLNRRCRKENRPCVSYVDSGRLSSA